MIIYTGKQITGAIIELQKEILFPDGETPEWQQGHEPQLYKVLDELLHRLADIGTELPD